MISFLYWTLIDDSLVLSPKELIKFHVDLACNSKFWRHYFINKPLKMYICCSISFHQFLLRRSFFIHHNIEDRHAKTLKYNHHYQPEIIYLTGCFRRRQLAAVQNRSFPVSPPINWITLRLFFSHPSPTFWEEPAAMWWCVAVPLYLRTHSCIHGERWLTLDAHAQGNPISTVHHLSGSHWHLGIMSSSSSRRSIV
jgi:hypothetical protein